MKSSIELSLIVAYSRNYAIGKDNAMLWYLPNDMKFFKNTTWGQGVIMGRKTYESLGKWKPLPGRINIIVTKNKNYVAENANDQTHVCHTFEEAVVLAIHLGCKKIFVGGGGEIYNYALRQIKYPVTEIIATEVDATIQGDTFFPTVISVWHTYIKETLATYVKDEKHFADFKIVRYYR